MSIIMTTLQSALQPAASSALRARRRLPCLSISTSASVSVDNTQDCRDDTMSHELKDALFTAGLELRKSSPNLEAAALIEAEIALEERLRRTSLQ
jgi:hypothetical protein